MFEILLYLIFLLIFIFLYMLLKSMNKSMIATAICTLLIISIIVAPKLCIDSALLGISLFINKVFPSLFPFLIITSIMMNYDGVEIYSRILGNIMCKPLRLPLQCTFVLVVSILCGYPLGAKYACDLYEQGLIDHKTCQRLINIASNTSPLFAIGAVGTSMLKSSYIGYILLTANYISCFIMGILIPGKNYSVESNKIKIRDVKNKNIGDIIKHSVESSINTCLSIGGFVILFSVITSMIKSNIVFDIAVKKINYITGIQQELIGGTILGLVEMTNGCHLISSAPVDMYTKVIIISFLLAFSGFSIISQVHSFTYKHNLSMKKYIVRKTMQGFIGAITAMLLYKMPILNFYTQAFNDNNNKIVNINFLLLIILLIIPYILGIAKKLFHTS